MFSKWVDFYRGYDEALWEELNSLLIRYDIPHRKQKATVGGKSAAIFGAGGNYPGQINSRIGYANPAAFTAGKELEKEEKGDKLYILFKDNTGPTELGWRIEGNKLIIVDSFGSEVVYIKK